MKGKILLVAGLAGGKGVAGRLLKAGKVPLPQGGSIAAAQSGVVSPVATKVVGGNQDCVFVSASGPQSANIILQLRQAGLDPATRVMGHNALASPQFVQRGGSAVEGVTLIGDWVPGGNTEFGRAFVAAYTAKYKSDPDNWAAVGYGGMRVAAAVLKAAGPNPSREAVRAAMSKAKDIKVVVGQGTYAVDADRVPHVGMNVLTVQNGKFVLAP